MQTEIIKKIYTAFKAKDLPAILALQAEDTQWSVAGPADKIPWASPRQGPEGVADFLKVLGGCWLLKSLKLGATLKARTK